MLRCSPWRLEDEWGDESVTSSPDAIFALSFLSDVIGKHALAVAEGGRSGEGDLLGRGRMTADGRKPTWTRCHAGTLGVLLATAAAVWKASAMVLISASSARRASAVSGRTR